MKNIKGYVTFYDVFADSNGGTSTRWQFQVGGVTVKTENQQVAETVRLAVETSSEVDISYDPDSKNTMSQVRIRFHYACESRELKGCEVASGENGEVEETKRICQTVRYSKCDLGHAEASDEQQ